VTLAPSPERPRAALRPYRRRIGRLDDPHRPNAVVGYLVTRVVVHWDTVGPHAAPLHVNPSERLEWRVHFTEASHPELFCDDVADLRPHAVDELATGRFVVSGRELGVTWLEGPEADDAWRDLGW
jgi:hypothetical protein